MSIPYGAYIVCPLEECEWKLRADVGLTPARYVVTDLTTESIHAAVTQVARKRAWMTEEVIREHLRTHDPMDYLQTIAALRQRLGQYEPVPDVVESHWPGWRR